MKIAVATSLMTVIATSSAVSVEHRRAQPDQPAARHAARGRVSRGRRCGRPDVSALSDETLFLWFAFVTGLIAVMVLTRLDQRNVLDASVDPGRLGGRFYDDESGREVVYQVKRLPVALVVSVLAGAVSGSLGIGGGIFKVPLLNAWCGVPLRAAAATSALMIGVTAAASVPIQYANHYIQPPLAAAAVLGVLGGSRVGLWFGGRAKARWLKMLLAAILALVSIVHLVKVLGRMQTIRSNVSNITLASCFTAGVTTQRRPPLRPGLRCS